MLTAVLALMPDPDWAVREQLAASLGELPPGTKETALVAFLERYANDPVAMDAALSGLNGSESAVLETLLRATSETPQRAMAITMLAATIVSNAQDAPIQRLFDAVAETPRPAWQRSALLRGAEVTLLSVDAITGRARTRARRAAPAGEAAPCPTCPGGRAGPGGASAFPRARGAADPSLQEGNAQGGAPAAGRGGRGRGAGTARAEAHARARHRGAGRERRRPVVAPDGCPRAAGVARQARHGRTCRARSHRRSRRVSRRAGPSTRTCARPAINRTGAAWRSWRRPSSDPSSRSHRPHDPDPDRAERQRGKRRAHASARRDAERRADCGRAHLHQARMGTRRVADRRRGRRAGAEGHRRPCPGRGPTTSSRGSWEVAEAIRRRLRAARNSTTAVSSSGVSRSSKAGMSAFASTAAGSVIHVCSHLASRFSPRRSDRARYSRPRRR